MRQLKTNITKFFKEDIISYARSSWSVCWPIVLIMLFEFLIGLADVYIAGRIGKKVQASYGMAQQLYFALVVVGNSLTTGTVSVVSRLFTSGKKEEYSRAVYSSYLTAGLAGILLAAAGWFIVPHVVRSMDVPVELKEAITTLVRIYAIGLFFHYILANSNGILRASNMVRKSLSTMAIVCLMNIVLNVYFVFYTSLGYKGIALSTAVSVLVGSLLNIMKIAHLITRIKVFSMDLMKRIVGIGWPMALLQVAWQLGMTVIFLILAALPRNNVELMAALTGGLRIEAMIFFLAFAFNQANAVIIGNLMGQGKKKEAFIAGAVTGMLGMALVTGLTVTVFMNAKQVASLLSRDPMVVAETTRYLRIVLLSEPFMALGIILGGGLNGAGFTRSVMKRVVFSLWVIRVPLGFLFAVTLGLGAEALWWCMNLSILVQCVLISHKYFKREWMTKIPRYAVLSQ